MSVWKLATNEEIKLYNQERRAMGRDSIYLVSSLEPYEVSTGRVTKEVGTHEVVSYLLSDDSKFTKFSGILLGNRNAVEATLNEYNEGVINA